MSLDRAMNLLGLVPLLLCFGMAASRILMRDVRALVGQDVTIRFAHFELEVGVREALDSLARTYEREHPHVNVEQIVVPQQFYKQWIRSRCRFGVQAGFLELPASPGREIGAALERDISHNYEDRRRDTRLQDTIIAAYRESALLRKSDADLPEKERISMNLIIPCSS